MATGNPFLGQVRRSIGDVTFYRRNGKQVTRARNRNPRNPSTYPQVVQRAIMSTVMRMYSAGQELFDHSFEGKEVAAGSQSEFMRVNLNIIRKKVISELNAVTQQDLSRVFVTAKGLNVAVPNMYQISGGSYPQNYIRAEQIQDGLGSIQLPAATADQTIADYCQENGLIADDIYTICYLGVNKDDVMFLAGEEGNDYATVFNSKFGYIQLKVKATAVSDVTVITASTKMTDIFEIYGGAASLQTRLLDDTIIPADVVGNDYGDAGCGGIIRSREDSGERSTSYMYLFNPEYGLATAWLLEGWTQANKLNSASELILEGVNF